MMYKNQLVHRLLDHCFRCKLWSRKDILPHKHPLSRLLPRRYPGQGILWYNFHSGRYQSPSRCRLFCHHTHLCIRGDTGNHQYRCRLSRKLMDSLESNHTVESHSLRSGKDRWCLRCKCFRCNMSIQVDTRPCCKMYGFSAADLTSASEDRGFEGLK